MQWGLSSWGCFSHLLLLRVWWQHFWGSWEDCYKWKRLSQMLLVCYSLLHRRRISSITLKKVGYWDTSGIPMKKKLQNLHRKRSNDWPMMTFIHSGSKIIIYSDSRGNKLDGVELATSLHFKTKTIKSKATFLRTSFFEAVDHYISTRTLELYFSLLKQLLL